MKEKKKKIEIKLEFQGDYNQLMLFQAQIIIIKDLKTINY
jgi:hypothetical protein